MIRIGNPEPVFIFGAKPCKPFDQPEGCIRWRLRLSNKSFASVFLRFNDRVEYWIVAERNGRWFPKYHQRTIKIL